jgi:hypothetical protein
MSNITTIEEYLGYMPGPGKTFATTLQYKLLDRDETIRVIQKLGSGGNIKLLRLWLWCVMTAAYKKMQSRGYEGTNFQAYDLDIGELLWRTLKSARECCTHRLVISRYLQNLQALDLVSITRGGELDTLDIVKVIRYEYLVWSQNSIPKTSTSGAVKWHKLWIGKQDQNDIFVPSPVSNLNYSAFAVAVYLWVNASFTVAQGCVNCTVSSICEDTGLCEKSVRNAISELSGIGFVDRLDYKQGRHLPLTLKLRWYYDFTLSEKEIKELNSTV